MKVSSLKALIEDFGFDHEVQAQLEEIIMNLLLWNSQIPQLNNPINESLLNSYSKEKWMVVIQSSTSRKKFALSGQLALKVIYEIDSMCQHVPPTYSKNRKKWSFYQFVLIELVPYLSGLVSRPVMNQFIDEVSSIILEIPYVERSFERWLIRNSKDASSK